MHRSIDSFTQHIIHEYSRDIELIHVNTGADRRQLRCYISIEGAWVMPKTIFIGIDPLHITYLVIRVFPHPQTTTTSPLIHIYEHK